MRPEEYTVFLVDDDVELQRSLKRLFAAEDLPVKAYSTAQEFLDAFNPESKGCLVLDVWLPGMSGIGLQKYLMTDGISIPIIFITGQADIPMVVEAMKCGAADFIVKPFRGQELLNRVHQVLARDANARRRVPAQAAHAVRT